MPVSFQRAEFENWEYVRDERTLVFANENTGFSAVIFRNGGTSEVIVALTGSNSLDAQDWWANLNLGMTQWSNERGGDDLVQYLLDNFQLWKIHFTGQSLGGALAQYAAHDYARSLGDQFNPDLVTLTTFNGLGAYEGLNGRERSDPDSPVNRFMPNVLAGVSTAHYVITNDLASRLGGNNLNESETYLLDFRKFGPNHPIDSALSIVDAHRIESGFYQGFTRYQTDFTSAKKNIPPNLNAASIQPIAAALGNLLNAHTSSDQPAEASARILAGVLNGLLMASPADLAAFWSEVVDHLNRSNNVPNPVYANSLKALGMSAIATAKTNPGSTAALAASSLLFAAVADLVDAAADAADTFISSRAEELLPEHIFEPVLTLGLQRPTSAERRITYATALNVLSEQQNDSALGSLELDIGGYLTSLATANGDKDSLEFLANAARDQGRSVAGIHAEATSAYFEAAKLSGELTLQLYDATVERLSDSVEAIAKGIGNAFLALTRKSTDTEFDLGRTVSAFAEVQLLADSYDAILAEASLNPVLRQLLEDARGIVEQAAQSVLVVDGWPGSNPFDAPGFDPDAYALPAAPLAEGSVRTLTAFLPYEAGPEGQRLTFTLTGGAASQLAVLSGGEPVSVSADGTFTLSIAEGRREVNFGLLANRDIDADFSLALSAALVDAAGETTHATAREATVLLDGNDESAGMPSFVLEYHGDWGVRLYPSALGNPYEVRRDERFADTPGYLNLERDPAQAEGNVIEGLVQTINGTDGPDRLFAGSRDSNLTVTGWGGNDLIHGTQGVPNLLVGDSGSNFLGSIGNDLIEGGVAGPVLLGQPEFNGRTITNAGDDSIFAGPGDDVAFADARDSMHEVLDAGTPHLAQKGDWITAGRGQDRIYGSAADDALFGGGDGDVIFGGAGNDVLDGDDDYENGGHPWWQVDSGGFVVTFHPVTNARWENPGYEYYRQWGGADVLDGGTGDDFLFGMWGDDTLLGGAGQDWLEGWEGADTLYGGDGNDNLYGEFGRFEQPWERSTGSSYTVSPGAVGYTGNAGTVELRGNDFIDGGAGNDNVYGEGGDDSLVGGDGDDTLYGDADYLPDEFAGNDFLDGGVGVDALYGLAGDDKLYGGEGADSLHGASGADFLDGGADADLLDGGTGSDVLHGRAGADHLFGGDGNDTLHGGEGDDTISGDDGDDVLHGDAGSDNIAGGSGNDALYGGAGEDVVSGGDGDDLIDAGSGVDVVRGGSGNDIYVLDFGYGQDVIEDAEGVNRIVFRSGIDPSQLRATMSDLTLTLAYGVGSDAVTLDLSQVQVSGIDFAGGTGWSTRELINFAPRVQFQGSDGDDALSGTPYAGSSLHGFDGDDQILGGQYVDVLEGGDGSDSLDGGGDSDTYFFTGIESGVDFVSDSSIESIRYLDWYYGIRGIENWYERATHPGEWRVQFDGGDIEYFASEADAAAAGGSSAQVVAPLEEHAPRIARGDGMFAQLQAEGILATDVIEFGSTHSLSELDISVTVDSLAAEEHPERPWYSGGRVSIRWAGGAGVDFLASPVDGGFESQDLLLGTIGGQQAGDGSWRGYRLGEGIEGVRFADGTYLALDEFLAGATVVPVLDNYAFSRNSGEQIIDRRYAAIEFTDGITSSEVSFARDDLDLLVIAAGAVGRIQGWYEDPANLPQMSFEFAGEPAIDAATATAMGLEMHGSSGNDSLVGLDDYADFLVGGPGDDYLDGGAGADTYLFNIGDGVDVIADPGPSVIRFGDDVIPGFVGIGLGSPLVRYGDGDTIRFAAFDADNPYATRVFDRLEFADGSSIAYEDLIANGFYLNGTEGDDVITGSGVHDQIFGNGGNDVLFGQGANDDVHGGDGDDTLSGGPGDGDLLVGEEGADTFVYAVGDGRDEIYEWDETPGETDRVRLQGFDVADVRVSRDPWNYYLAMDGGDWLTFGNMPLDAAAVVERIEFDDGTVWTPEDLEARVALFAATEGEDVLWGTSANDSISGLGGIDSLFGNGGDDSLIGGEGEDYYYFAAGDGHDTVDNFDSDGSYDSFQFADATSSGVALSRSGSDLVFTAGADSVAIAGWYADERRRIDSVYFEADGTYWDAAMIEQLAPVGGNSAPQLANPLGDLSFEAGATFSIFVASDTFTDQDVGDTLVLSASLHDGSPLAAWLSFDAATGVFTGSPQPSNIGVSHIAVTATDPDGASATADFGLIVHAAAGSTVTGGASDDAIYGGAGDETLVARGGSDYVYGDVGDDLLRGGAGTDVLQGGGGSDVLRGGAGQNVLDGGAGDDLIYGGAGSAFIAGGAGNDMLRVGKGGDVIAFNAGDGMDTVYGGRDGGNTLSLGGGIRYSDISLSKSGKDLVVSTGAGEGVTLKNWYAGNHSVLSLQVMLDATEEFDAGSSDPLYSRRVQTFNFLAMVSAFDAARAAVPGLTSWEITNALLAFHLSGVDDAALGGDLAYWYSKNRTLQGISLQSAQQVIGAEGFGSEAQTLRPFSGLQEGFVELA